MHTCRLALLLLTAQTVTPDARAVMTSMVLQALLAPRPPEGPAKPPGLVECASFALLLNLLYYLLLQAPEPPAPSLINNVDALLKVNMHNLHWTHAGLYHNMPCCVYF